MGWPRTPTRMILGSARIDDDGADVARVLQADVGPGGAGVGGSVNAVAVGLLTCADDDDVVIRGGDGEVADGGDVLIVEDGFPGYSCVGGFPDAAAGQAHVIRGGVAGNSCNGGDAAGAVGADHAPAEGGVEAGIDGLRGGRGRLLGVERRGGCSDDEQKQRKKAATSKQGGPPRNSKVYHWWGLRSV